MAKNSKDLSEQEILALAVSSEETDARIYADFAAGLKADYPGTDQIFNRPGSFAASTKGGSGEYPARKKRKSCTRAIAMS